MRTLLAFAPLICGGLNGFATTPRSGWVLVPGAEDLVQNGIWSCNPGVAVAPNSFAVTSGSASYNTIINTSGPVLKTPGDFSVLATLSASSSAGAWLTLVGTLNTGSDFWNGLKRLDVGYSGTAISANYWTGSSANATPQSFQTAAAANTAINLEVARIGAQIVVFVDGVKAGSFNDPGLFASGQVYLGVNVAPQNTLTVLSLAASMPAGSSATVSAPYLQVAARNGTALRDSAEPAGFLLGAAVDPSHFTDPGYVQALGREFNLLVPENAMKFAETEPSPHAFNFCAADQIVAYAQANSMKVRGHNLVWQQDLPPWLTGGNYSSADAAAILKEHIETVMGHYQGRLIEWDVVNEAIAYGAPYGPQPSYWLDQLGSSYIDQAFLWAHAADPNAKLYYNDTGGEGLGAKSDAVYNLVKGMVSRGIPINGVGLQMHAALTPAPSPDDIASNIARLGALGLEVHITEMDVRVPTPASAASLDAAAVVYQNVLSACAANSNCTALLTWGVSDAYSWIPGVYPGFGAALLLDAQYQAKPAYTAVAGVLRSMNSRRPMIGTGGVVIHGGTAAVVSPGSLVDVYGSNLAPAPATTPGVPLLTTLGSVQVTVNGTAAPLYYVSSGLIIFQLPYEIAPGPALIQAIANGVAGSSAGITVQQAAPSLLTYGANRAVVQNPDHSVNGPGNCAAPGSTLTAYLMGSGPLDHPVPTGAAAPLTSYASETLGTTALLGSTPAPVTFAGLTPGSVGLLQMNFQVPQVSGDVPLSVQIGAFTSNQALVCVGN